MRSLVLECRGYSNNSVGDTSPNTMQNTVGVGSRQFLKPIIRSNVLNSFNKSMVMGIDTSSGMRSSKLRTVTRSMIGPTRTGSENPTEAKVDATFPPYLPNLDQDYEIKMRFQEFANWLIPGSLMAGRYPFVEPSRCRDRKTGEEMLEALITAGVTTFISLQEEIPPQGEMPLKGVGGFLPYKPAATLIATALSDPPGIDEMNGLRTPYLDKYLPPRKKDVGSARRRRVELDFVHSPITDLGLPGEEQLDTLVKDISDRIRKGECIYIHCWGGRGRAGTVGAATLSTMYGLSAEESLERIQKAFDTRNDGNRLSPESPEQVEFVTGFIRKRLE